MTKVFNEKYRDRHGKIIPMETWVECSCVEINRIKELFASSAITEEMQRFRFEDFILDGRPAVVRDAFNAAVEYDQLFPEIRKDRHNSIYLGGNPGSGKTTLLMCIANRLLANGIPVLYFPFVEGMLELNGDMSDNEKYRAKTERLMKVPVLFIDDLFKPIMDYTPTRNDIRFLYAIINYRYLNHLPMLISSELNKNTLLFWDQAIGSRIIEMAARFTVTLEGADDLNYRLPEEEQTEEGH